MTLHAYCLHFLKYLARRDESISVGNIKSRILGQKKVSSQDILEELVTRAYATIDNNQIKITDTGKDFLENFEKKELAHIEPLVFDEYDLALIGFLFHRNDYVKLEDFPEILKKCAPQHGNSINDGNLMQSLFRLEPYINEESGWYMINDIGRSYYKSKIAKYVQETAHQANSSRKKEFEQHTGQNVAIPDLTEPERIWLTELYRLTKEGRIFTYRELWTNLADKIPRNFKTAAVDEKLMSANGEKIHVLGVVAVEKSFGIIDQINTIVDAIRGSLLRNETIQEISIHEIAKVCKLTTLEVSFCLHLARYSVNLYNSSSYKEDSTEMITIGVGNEAIFYNYLHFEGIEFYLTKPFTKQHPAGDAYFSKEEILVVNEKLDDLLQQMRTVVLSQEFTYNDVMEELNELRTLFGLKKKNWRRLLVMKVAEMTTEGMAASMLFDPLADVVKSDFSKLLSH